MIEKIDKKEFDDFQKWKKAKDNADAVEEQQQRQEEIKPKTEKLNLINNPDKSKMEEETKKPEEKDEWKCAECGAVLGTADNPPKFCSECGSELEEK